MLIAYQAEALPRITASDLADPTGLPGSPVWFISNHMERIVHVSIQIRESQ